MAKSHLWLSMANGVLEERWRAVRGVVELIAARTDLFHRSNETLTTQAGGSPYINV
jgi:hypothetical protein